MPDPIDNAIKAGAITMDETKRLRALHQDRELRGVSFELVTLTLEGKETRTRIHPSMVRYNHVTGEYAIIDLATKKGGNGG
jgi:hypothetical protein